MTKITKVDVDTKEEVDVAIPAKTPKEMDRGELLVEVDALNNLIEEMGKDSLEGQKLMDALQEKYDSRKTAHRFEEFTKMGLVATKKSDDTLISSLTDQARNMEFRIGVLKHLVHKMNAELNWDISYLKPHIG